MDESSVPTLDAVLTQLQQLDARVQRLTSHAPDAAPPRSAPRKPRSPAALRRQQAFDAHILTEHGWRAGYEVLLCSRWMDRIWPDVVALNDAMTHLETNSFTLVGGLPGFAAQVQAFYQQLADYRVWTKALTREAERLASGRLGRHASRPPEESPSPETERDALHGPTPAERRARAAAEASG